MPQPNMIQFTGSYRQPKVGDIFRVDFPGRHCFGRVVSLTAEVGKSMPGAVLLYFFRPGLQWDSPGGLSATNLLIPPLMTNKRPWSMRYFKTVESREFGPGEVLPRHCFRSPFGKYYDEKSTEILDPVEPIGDWGLNSFLTIDDQLSDALGIPRIAPG
jgi:Immunity protein 26